MLAQTNEKTKNSQKPKNPRSDRLIIIILFAIFISIVCFIWMLSTIGLLPYGLSNLIPEIFTAFGTFLPILYLFPRNNQNEELVSVREERKEINERLKDNPQEDVLDTIRLGLSQLTEYYIINKSQAKSSFNSSLFAIVVGLATIISGIWLLYFQYHSLELATVTGISGLLLQFIGGAYFFIYRKSIDQMNDYFSQLVRMQDTMLAIKLCRDLPDASKHIELMEKVIIALMERTRTLSFAKVNA